MQGAVQGAVQGHVEIGKNWRPPVPCTSTKRFRRVSRTSVAFGLHPAAASKMHDFDDGLGGALSGVPSFLTDKYVLARWESSESFPKNSKLIRVPS